MLKNVAYGNNIFVAIDNYRKTLTSTNGIDWEVHNVISDKQINCLIFGNGLFITVGNTGTILTGLNGVNWENRISSVSANLDNIIYKENIFVIIGDIGVILNSYISETLNLISDLTPDSDMIFNLEVGNNDILYSDDNGNGATLKFRQKYIGV